MKTDQQGVTLLEVMAVIAIFSVLGVGLAQIYTGQQERQTRDSFLATAAQMQVQFGDASVRFVEDNWSQCGSATLIQDGDGDGIWDAGDVCRILYSDISDRLPDNYGGPDHETPFGQRHVSYAVKDTQNNGVPNPDAYRLLTTDANAINTAVVREVGYGANDQSIRSIKFQNVTRLNRFYTRPNRAHGVIFRGTTTANGSNQAFSCDVSDYVGTSPEDRIALIYFDSACSG